MVAHERLTEQRVTIEWHLAKRWSFSNLPAFLDFNGIEWKKSLSYQKWTHCHSLSFWAYQALPIGMLYGKTSSEKIFKISSEGFWDLWINESWRETIHVPFLVISSLKWFSKLRHESLSKWFLPWKFWKAGRGVVWWRTRDPRVTCHNRVTVTKRQHFLKSSCFSRSSW